MNENTIEQTETLSQTVDTEQKTTEGDVKETVSLGKFKDVNALLNAYNSLQSEFTKRCQRVKELENALTDEKTKVSAVKESTAEVGQANAGITEEDRQNILKDYLKGLLGSKQTAIVMDGVGGGVSTPVNRPKTIAEAGNLAKEILK